MTGISQVDGGDVAEILQQYTQEQLEAIALRAYEEELAYAQRAEAQIKEKAA